LNEHPTCGRIDALFILALTAPYDTVGTAGRQRLRIPCRRRKATPGLVDETPILPLRIEITARPAAAMLSSLLGTISYSRTPVNQIKGVAALLIRSNVE